MKIKIESDVFDIVDRIKEIDEAYYVVYDSIRNCFEVHNYNQISSYCLTVPFCCLDNRVLDILFKSESRNIDKIIEYIDNNNKIIESNNRNKISEITEFDSREIFDFSSNSSKQWNEKDFEMVWS
ncbi:MAG: hypothetical protein IJW59_01910 [Clostridia bacterium]|nr:hypothetical protein [Clostridia bacterium]